MPTHDEPERIKNATPSCLSTISGGWMKILRLLTHLLTRLRFFPYKTPHGPPAGPPAPTACVPPPPPPPPPPQPPPASSFLRSARPHNHPSPFVRTSELRRALKNLVYCDLTSVEYKRENHKHWEYSVERAMADLKVQTGQRQLRNQDKKSE